MRRLWRRLLWRIGWLKLTPDEWRFPIVEQVQLCGGRADGSKIWISQGGLEIAFPLYVPWARSGGFGRIVYRDTGLTVEGRRVFRISPGSFAALEELDQPGSEPGVFAGIVI